MNNQVINQEASQDFTNNLAKKMHPTATGEVLESIQSEFSRNYATFRRTHNLQDCFNIRQKYSMILALGFDGDNIIKLVYIPANGSSINGNKDFVISYQGLRYLYKRLGINVDVELVFKDDILSVKKDENGDIESIVLESVNIFDQSVDTIVGAFAKIVYPDGYIDFLHLTKKELDDIRGMGAKGSKAWEKSWRKMYKKIMYRNIFEHVVLSSHSGGGKEMSKIQEALIVDEPTEETKQIQTVGEKMQEQVKAEQVEADIIDEFNEILGG